MSNQARWAKNRHALGHSNVMGARVFELTPPARPWYIFSVTAAIAGNAFATRMNGGAGLVVRNSTSGPNCIACLGCVGRTLRRKDRRGCK